MSYRRCHTRAQKRRKVTPQRKNIIEFQFSRRFMIMILRCISMFVFSNVCVSSATTLHAIWQSWYVLNLRSCILQVLEVFAFDLSIFQLLRFIWVFCNCNVQPQQWLTKKPHRQLW